jgi:hypothetical protein
MQADTANPALTQNTSLGDLSPSGGCSRLFPAQYQYTGQYLLGAKTLCELIWAI